VQKPQVDEGGEVRGSRRKLLPVVAAAAVILSLAGAAAAGTERGSALGAAAQSLIYAGSADPTYLDPALVSDGESFRVARQIFDTLVGLKPGTTTLVPRLATKWGVADDRVTWTFTLRRGVRFHDGTAFNAAAVCANFNRWYNWRGPFQSATATYYYQTLFGGYRRNESPELSPPLFRSCRAANATTAVIKLTRPSGPFVQSLVLPAFAMQSPTAMRRYGADRGELRSGTFYPTGAYPFRHPTGTGPYKFESWTVGERVVLTRNARYWGRPKPRLARIIIRPISDNTARVQALQTGEIYGLDNLSPSLIGTVRGNARLKVLNRPMFNVAYVTINSAKPPMNRLAVRRAVAHGLNRAAVVRSFYEGRGILAHQFQPPSLWGYEPKVPKYPYNPSRSRELLRQAGCSPCKIEFWWPTGVTRPYMPDPKRNFEAFKASLEASGFEVEARSAPWRPDYVKNVNDGTAGHLNLIGWTGDYADPDNFLGTFFQGFNPQFGERNAQLDRILNAAERETNFAKRVRMYKQANRIIMANVLGVPYAHSRPAVGLQRRVRGYVTSPVGTDEFLTVSVGGQ
jgi:peptide/nickel transport system substrate-binding protein